MDVKAGPPIGVADTPVFKLVFQLISADTLATDCTRCTTPRAPPHAVRNFPRQRATGNWLTLERGLVFEIHYYLSVDRTA